MAAAGQGRVSSGYRHPEESSHQPSDCILFCEWKGEPNRLVWFVLRHPRAEKQRRCAAASRRGGWGGGSVGAVEVFPCRINCALRPSSCNAQPAPQLQTPLRGGRQRPLLGARRVSRAAKAGGAVPPGGPVLQALRGRCARRGSLRAPGSVCLCVTRSCHEACPAATALRERQRGTVRVEQMEFLHVERIAPIGILQRLVTVGGDQRVGVCVRVCERAWAFQQR